MTLQLQQLHDTIFSFFSNRGTIADLGRSVAAGRLRCPFPAEQAGDPWRQVQLKCKNNRSKLTGSAFLTVPVVRDTPPPPKLSFAHCGPPMHHQFDRPASLVEYIEYYRLMGVSKFFWYEVSVSDRTKAVMDYYQRAGLLDVTRWSIPTKVGTRVHYFGQVAAIYDCVLKTSRHFDYTIVGKLAIELQLMPTPWCWRVYYRTDDVNCFFFVMEQIGKGKQ